MSPPERRNILVVVFVFVLTSHQQLRSYEPPHVISNNMAF